MPSECALVMTCRHHRDIESSAPTSGESLFVALKASLVLSAVVPPGSPALPGRGVPGGLLGSIHLVSQPRPALGDETDDPVHDSPRSEGSPPPSGADGDDDGFHEHIQFGWDTRVSGNGKHEVLTDLTATLFLHAVAGDPYSPSVRCANSSLSAWLGWFVCAEFHRLFGQYGDTVQS
jgi:hypothetical protein